METKSLKSNLPAIAFALAALAAIHPSSAIAGGEPVTEAVQYGDLNLATEAGIRALDRRLDRAVKRVCGEHSIRSLRTERLVTKCEEEAWQSVQDEREFAIARATGRQDAVQAGNAARTATRVSLAE